MRPPGRSRPGGPKYIRDDYGEAREVHRDTREGAWTGPRDFARTFRGVAKNYLRRSIAMFE